VDKPITVIAVFQLRESVPKALPLWPENVPSESLPRCQQNEDRVAPKQVRLAIETIFGLGLPQEDGILYENARCPRQR
jgi:hypothetical protein